MAKIYKVVPFVAKITSKDNTHEVADQLEITINDYAKADWQFESLERIETNVTPIGCFGGKDKAQTNFFQLIVFSK